MARLQVDLEIIQIGFVQLNASFALADLASHLVKSLY
jgi:hypothetical protein